MIALAVIVVVLATGFRRDQRDIRTGTVGKPAPLFELPLAEGGGRLRLADELAAGKVVVLNFFASWCVACREEHPSLVRVWERYRTSDVLFVDIVYQDTPENAIAYRREMGGDWPLVLDPGTRTALAYGVFGVPEKFFIGRDGVIAGRHIGAIDEATMIVGIEAIRAKDRR
ncbi:MAG: TlpA family protein disulfide reductase [Candidatus Limnocylindria bacterium]